MHQHVLNIPLVLSDGYTGYHGTCMEHCIPSISNVLPKINTITMIPSTASQQQQPAEKSSSHKNYWSIAWLNIGLKSLHTLRIAEIFTWKKLSLNCLNTETFDRAHLRVKGKKKIHIFLSSRDTFLPSIFFFCWRYFGFLRPVTT